MKNIMYSDGEDAVHPHKHNRVDRTEKGTFVLPDLDNCPDENLNLASLNFS
jgi:hypothetical protein